MTMRAGFIGLGSQGKPIAAHLPSVFETTVYDVVPGPVEELVSSGARAAASPREVGEGADLVGICVPEDEHVRSVVFGTSGEAGGDGLLAGLPSGAAILIHSTILPETAIAIGEAARERGVEVLDACVTGGAARAASRQLTYLVGGSEEAMARARPYLEATTDVEPIHAGPLGNGCKLKLCVNLVTYIQWAAAFESMTLARAVGLPQEVLERAGRSNGQITDMMLAFLGTHKAPPETRESDTFQRAMRTNMQIAEKDLAWALQLARKSDVGLPVGGLVSQLMARLYGVRDEGRR